MYVTVQLQNKIKFLRFNDGLKFTLFLIQNMPISRNWQITSIGSRAISEIKPLTPRATKTECNMDMNSAVKTFEMR